MVQAKILIVTHAYANDAAADVVIKKNDRTYWAGLEAPRALAFYCRLHGDMHSIPTGLESSCSQLAQARVRNEVPATYPLSMTVKYPNHVWTDGGWAQAGAAEFGFSYAMMEPDGPGTFKNLTRTTKVGGKTLFIEFLLVVQNA